MKRVDKKRKSPRSFSIFMVFIVIVAVSFLLSLFLPFFEGVYEEVRIILTITAILFSIFVGFSIAYLFTRFNDIRKLVAAETGILTNLYKFFENLGKSKYTMMMRKSVDDYLTAVLDFHLHEHIDKVRKEYFNLFEPIKAVRKEKIHNANYVYNRSLALMHEFGNLRKTNIVLVKTKLSFYHWLILVVLGFILVSVLLYLRNPTPFSIIATSLLMIAIATVLLVVKDLENLQWGSEVLWVESYERVFDVIEMPRYYPEYIVKEGFKLPEDKDYRYVTYDDKQKKKIELVKVK